MKKNNERKRKTLLFDKISLLSIATVFFVALVGYILQIVFKWEYTPRTYKGHYHYILKILPYILFPVFLLQFRFRTITPKGIYATFFGIPYKRILWEKVEFCKIDSADPWIWGEGSDDARAMLFFKSKLNSRYKTTIISIDATPETIALAKKYYKKEIYDLTQMDVK